MGVNDRDPHKLFPHDHVMKYTLVPLVPRWISPNHVTIFRFLMTPVVLWLLWEQNYSVGVPLFLGVAFTDALDGSIARLRKKITPWGTFYDPVADKLLIGSVVLLIVLQHIDVTFGLIIVGIELLIILGGYYRRLKGSVSGANIFGKTKMFLQVLGVTLLLLALWLGVELFIPISIGTLSLAIVFAVISLFTYGL